MVEQFIPPASIEQKQQWLRFGVRLNAVAVPDVLQGYRPELHQGNPSDKSVAWIDSATHSRRGHRRQPDRTSHATGKVRSRDTFTLTVLV